MSFNFHRKTAVQILAAISKENQNSHFEFNNFLSSDRSEKSRPICLAKEEEEEEEEVVDC